MDKEKNIDEKLNDWVKGDLSDENRKRLSEQFDLDLMNKMLKHTGDLPLPEYDVSDEWSKLHQNIKQKDSSKIFSIRRYTIVGIAASLLVIVGGLLWMVSSEKDFRNSAEKIVSHELPDGSSIQLTPNSSIKYKRFGWVKNRHVELNGSGVFSVESGNSFTVQFDLGKVSVLGTVFSIEERKNRRVVKCFEGKVSVRGNSNSIEISQGEGVTFDEENRLEKTNTELLAPHWTVSSSKYSNISLEKLILILEEIYELDIQHSIESPIQFSGTVIHNNASDALELAFSSIDLEYEFIYEDSLRLFQK